MSALETLRTLMRGDWPISGLLHTCRFEGLGSETYGEEAIIARLRQAPVVIDDDAVVIETATLIAVLSDEHAIFTDLYDGNIARLWVLGSEQIDVGEAGVAVTFDPDLAQARGDILFTVSDHPTLEFEASAKVIAVGREIVNSSDDARTRAFALRALGSAKAGAALFAVFRLRPDDRAAAGFSLAAGFWGEHETHIVRDFAGEGVLAEKPWTPHIP